VLTARYGLVIYIYFRAQAVGHQLFVEEARALPSSVHVGFVADTGHRNRLVSQYFCFPLSVSCQQHSILTFNHTPLLLTCKFYGFIPSIQRAVVTESGVN